MSEKTESTYEVAKQWLDRGVELLPVQPRSKALVTGYGPHRAHITTEDQARWWFGEHKCNLGLAMGTGRDGKLIALDFDDESKYLAWSSSCPFAHTLTERSGRGFHVFFFVDTQLPDLIIHNSGAEIKASGTVIVTSPSIHPSGAVYEYLEKCEVMYVKGFIESFAVNNSPKLFPTKQKQLNTSRGDSTIVKIKKAMPILSYAESLTTLKPSSKDGRWYIGQCPLHNDTNPSFWIDTLQNRAGCHSSSCYLGGAGKSADIINLYALVNGLDLVDAIRQLAIEAGL